MARMYMFVSHWRRGTFARGSHCTSRDRIFTCVSCWSVVTSDVKVLGNELSLQHQRPWCVQISVPLCTFMEGRSVTLFWNAVLRHYNYWNSGSRLVYVVIDCHFLCKHKKVQKNAYLFWHEHTVCNCLCHATDVFTHLIVELLSNLIAESLKTSFICQYIHFSSSISR